jgi:hypothetical protein
MFALMSSDWLIPMFAMAIPMVAVTGGIVIAIVQALGRQRMIELAQRERIAAIERGIDPATLPPLNIGKSDLSGLDFGDRHSPLRRAQGLVIGGLVTLFAGFGLSILLRSVNDPDANSAWAVGLIPMLVGLALLISAFVVWPRGGNGSS